MFSRIGKTSAFRFMSFVFLLSACVTLQSFATSLALASCPPKDASSPVLDDFLFGIGWQNPIIIGEFALTQDGISTAEPSKNCPNNATYFKLPGTNQIELDSAKPTVHAWFRFQGNAAYFFDGESQRVVKGIVTANFVKSDEGLVIDNEYKSRIKYSKVIGEISDNLKKERELEYSDTDQYQAFFDWRENFQSKQIREGDYSVVIKIDGKPVVCVPEEMAGCECQGQAPNRVCAIHFSAFGD